MYIEYVTPQRVADPRFTDYKSRGGDYRPTWLVRTSDWKKVPGHEATDGYHTLSYVWEQSGEMFKKDDGEYGLEDNGRHKIIRIEKEHRHISNLLRHRQKVPVEQLVTYDELLQQVCKDFEIDYLWYDKICINQLSKEEKHREIKQMHLIYSNACYTLAFVPEIDIKDEKEFEEYPWSDDQTTAKNNAFGDMLSSLWWKRSWTLEELMMSTRTVVVGRNTHFWSLAKDKQETLKEKDYLSTDLLGFKDKKLKTVNQVLVLAHFRNSTKEHDKIFALANILHDIVNIDIDYDMDVSTAVNAFYRHLVELDLSVMCFGSVLNEDGSSRFATSMSTHGLPSWTGVAGLHVSHAISDITFDNHGDGYYVDEEMNLHMKCRGYTIYPTKYDTFDIQEDQERANRARDNHFGRTPPVKNDEALLDWGRLRMMLAGRCRATHYWRRTNAFHIYVDPLNALSLTEDECDKCIVLCVIFKIPHDNTLDNGEIVTNYYYLAPVVKVDGDSSTYKAIGLIHLHYHQFNEPRPFKPQALMNQMFKGYDALEAQEFCIK